MPLKMSEEEPVKFQGQKHEQIENEIYVKNRESLDTIEMQRGISGNSGQSGNFSQNGHFGQHGNFGQNGNFGQQSPGHAHFQPQNQFSRNLGSQQHSGQVSDSYG